MGQKLSAYVCSYVQPWPLWQITVKSFCEFSHRIFSTITLEKLNRPNPDTDFWYQCVYFCCKARNAHTRISANCRLPLCWYILTCMYVGTYSNCDFAKLLKYYHYNLTFRISIDTKAKLEAKWTFKKQQKYRKLHYKNKITVLTSKRPSKFVHTSNHKCEQKTWKTSSLRYCEE